MRKLISIVAVLAVVTLLLPAVALAQPDYCGFWGSATLDGEDVDIGTQVSAWTDGGKVAETTVVSTSEGPMYSLDIVQPSGASYDGEEVSFKISEYNAIEKGTWEAGKNERRNISATPGIGPITPGVEIEVEWDWNLGNSTYEDGVLTLHLGPQPQGLPGAAGAPGAAGEDGEDAPGGIALPIVALVIAIIAAGVAMMSMRRRV